MSITRSISLLAPATDRPMWREFGLLLIGHGSEHSDGPNQQLIRQVDHLRGLGVFADVQGAVLYGEPTLQSAMKALGDRPVHVMPMFMCDGLFTREIIPARIDELQDDCRDITFETPIGLSDALGELIARRVSSRIAEDGFLETEVSVVLVGHGSTASDASWRATEHQAERLRILANLKSVTTAYLDQPPKLADVLAGLSGPVCVVGLFIADGLHAGGDIPAIIAQSGKAGDICYLGAIGRDPEIVELVVGELEG